MKLSRNLKLFIGINTVSTVLFILSLKFDWFVYPVPGEPDAYTTWLPAMYFLVWFVSGLILGITDRTRNSRSNLEFLYHAATGAINLVALLIALLVFPIGSLQDETRFFAIAAVLVGLTLGAHWLGVRHKLKGIDKKEAFK